MSDLGHAMNSCQKCLTKPIGVQATNLMKCRREVEASGQGSLGGHDHVRVSGAIASRGLAGSHAAWDVGKWRPQGKGFREIP